MIKKKILRLFLFVFLISILFFIGNAPKTAGDTSNWWNINYRFCRNITINNIGSTTLTNFPTFLNISYHPNMQNDFGDIRIIDTACDNGGNEFYYDLVNSTPGKDASVYVKTTLQPGSNVFAVYYGNSDSSSSSSPSNVWIQDYKSVYHLEHTSGTENDILGNFNLEDGISDDNNLRTMGVVGLSDTFDGSGDYIGINPEWDVDGAHAYEVWIKTTTTENDIVLEDGGTIDGHGVGVSADGKFRYAECYDDAHRTTNSTSSLNDDEWHYLVGGWNGTTQFLYIDGKLESILHGGDGLTGTDNARIGMANQNNAVFDDTSTHDFTGSIDELRVTNSTTTRTSDWINQTYTLIKYRNITNYVSFGSEQTILGEWWNTDYPKCQNITLVNVGETTLINFTSYVNLSYDSDMQPDFDDIIFVDRFCNSAGTQLNFEKENYTESIQADFWVKKTLAPGNNIISVYYGNSSKSDISDYHGVWDKDYVGVYHLDENSGIRYDSSQWGNNASLNGTVSTVGKVDGGNYFDRITPTFLTIQPNTELANITEGMMTVSAWFNLTDSISGSSRTILSQQDNGGTGRSILNSLEIGCTPDEIGSYLGGSPLCSGIAPTINTTWYYTSVTDNDTTVQLYVDGLLKASAFKSVDENARGDFLIGTSKDYTHSHEGDIDEVRISQIKRTLEWENQSYTQMAFPHATEYISFGTEESYTIQSPPTDSCTYSGSGNWVVDCSDGCNISSEVVGDGSDLQITGTGTFSTTADIRSFKKVYVIGNCKVYFIGGNFLP